VQRGKLLFKVSQSARAIVSWLYHFSAHLRKVLTASSAPAVLLSSSIMNPVAIYHFLLKVFSYIVIFVVSMMKWRFREGKLENFVHTHPQQGLGQVWSILDKFGPFWTSLIPLWLLECYQFALCGLSSILKLPISDAVWIRVSESQFRNSELLSLMANVQFL